MNILHIEVNLLIYCVTVKDQEGKYQHTSARSYDVIEAMDFPVAKKLRYKFFKNCQANMLNIIMGFRRSGLMQQSFFCFNSGSRGKLITVSWKLSCLKLKAMEI